jgi:hypothetical protein
MNSHIVKTSLLCVVFSSLSVAQRLSIGVCGGGAWIEGPESYTGAIADLGNGLRTDYSIGGKISLSFPASTFTLVGSVGYHFMNAAGTASSTIYSPAFNGNTEIRTHFISAALGGQWSILTGSIAPYVGVNALGSSFSKITRRVTNSFGTRDYSYGGGTSYGLGVDIGVELHLLPGVALDVNVVQNLYGFFSGSDPASPNVNAAGVNAGILVTIMWGVAPLNRGYMKILPALTGMLMVVICSTGFSQDLKLGFGGGPTFVQYVEGRAYAMDISLGGLGFGLSYSISGKAELSFPESPFSLVGRVSYLSMSGSGTLTSPGIYSQGTGNVETKLHFWSIGVGGEWKILQGPVAPFAGANVLLESFNNASYKLTNSAGSNEYLHGRGTAPGVGLEIGA